MATPLEAVLKQAIDRLWTQYLPEMQQRVSAIDAAACEYCDAARGAARDAAHKLAGVLGTFGLMDGTVLAREAEGLLAKYNATSALRLAEIAADLRQMIANR